MGRGVVSRSWLGRGRPYARCFAPRRDALSQSLGGGRHRAPASTSDNWGPGRGAGITRRPRRTARGDRGRRGRRAPLRVASTAEMVETAAAATWRIEARYRGKVATLEPKPFAAMMRELAEYEESAVKPEVYAYMLHSQDTQDHAAGRLLARVREASAERGRHMVFFSLELAEVSDEQAAKLFADPESAVYRHTVEEARKFRPHQLSEPEERVLTDFSPVGNGAWTRLFEELCARITVEVDGQELALDQALTLLREPNRDVRRKASAAVTEALQGDIRTRGYVFNVILQEKAIDDRLRQFPTWLSSRNLANETRSEERRVGKA